MSRWKVAALCFEHFHMGDNMRMVDEDPRAELVAVCDDRRERMDEFIDGYGIEKDRVFTDLRACIEQTGPDLLLLAPAAAHHGDWVEAAAPFGLPMLIEKPFAASLEEADRMIAAARKGGAPLAINWPMAWYPPHRTAKRLVDEGAIGRVQEVHYYDGNRGPLWHGAGKEEKTAEQVAAEKPHSWFYSKEAGGGSLQDYLGYGVTLGTWFLGGAAPSEVTAVTDEPPGLEVDEHSITIARYETGLCKFETRWGTFTDPWTHQPQPKCGFVLVGADGTISSYDFEPTIRVQTREHPGGRDVPVDRIEPPNQTPIQFMIDRLERGAPIDGPLSPETSRTGQRIVDAAVRSAAEKRTVALPD